MKQKEWKEKMKRLKKAYGMEGMIHATWTVGGSKMSGEGSAT